MAILFSSLFLSSLAEGAPWTEPSVAVLGIEPIDIPEALAQQLTDALRQRAAGTGGIKALAGKDLIEIKMIFNCDGENPSCMAQAGKSLGAEKLLYGTLKRVGGRSSSSVLVRLKLLDVGTATIEKFVNETVSKRELAQGGVNQSAARWFGALIELAKPTLTVTSDPTGSQVLLDGAPVGRTPLSLRDLSPGPHSVGVAQPGYQPFSKTLELKPGGTHEVVALLDKEKVTAPVVHKAPPPVVTHKIAPPPEPVAMPQPTIVAPPSEHPGRVAKIIGIAAIGAAVVMAGVAIYTWRSYSGLQDDAHNDLALLHPQVPGMPTAAEQSFFNAPGCSPPSTLTGNLQQYKNDCSSGTNLANATTALWVVSGLLAAGGVTAIIIGDRQASKARSGERPSAALRLRRSLQVAPLFSTQGGGVRAAFDF